MTDALLMSRSILPRAHKNACGTVGLLHALMNADNLEKDGWLKKFADNTESKDADGRADVLEGDTELDSCHAAAAEQGQVCGDGGCSWARVCAFALRCACANVARSVCRGACMGWRGGRERENKSAICTRSFPGLGFRL